MNDPQGTSVSLDLRDYGGPVYSGRSRGEAIRAKITLDTIDDNHVHMKILVPEEAYTVTSSFWLGLLGPSIKKLGSRDKFIEQFEIDMPSRFWPKLNYCIERALSKQQPLL